MKFRNQHFGLEQHDVFQHAYFSARDLPDIGMRFLGEPSEYGIDLASFKLPACQQIQYLAMLPLVHGLALVVVTMPCPPFQITHSWSSAAVYALCMLCLPGVASVIGRAARFRNGAVCPMLRRRVQGMGVELKETQQESPV